MAAGSDAAVHDAVSAARSMRRGYGTRLRCRRMPCMAGVAHGAVPAVRRCPTASSRLRPRFSQLCELANDPAQRPACDSPTERTALLGRCRRGRRTVGRLGIPIAARPGRAVEEPSESRQREHDEDCGERAEPAECRVVVIHARKSTRWRGQLGRGSGRLVAPRAENAEVRNSGPPPGRSQSRNLRGFGFVSIM